MHMGRDAVKIRTSAMSSLIFDVLYIGCFVYFGIRLTRSLRKCHRFAALLLIVFAGVSFLIAGYKHHGILANILGAIGIWALIGLLFIIWSGRFRENAR